MPFNGGILNSENIKSAIVVKTKDEINPMHNFNNSGRLSLTLAIQYKAQITELMVARKIPKGSSILKSKKASRDEIKYTPEKLIRIATKLFKWSF